MASTVQDSATTVHDALKTIVDAIDDLQQSQSQIEERQNISHINTDFSDEINRFKGIEKQLVKIEEVKKRNANSLATVMEMVETLSNKCDKISLIISDSKKKIDANTKKYREGADKPKTRNSLKHTETTSISCIERAEDTCVKDTFNSKGMNTGDDNSIVTDHKELNTTLISDPSQNFEVSIQNLQAPNDFTSGQSKIYESQALSHGVLVKTIQRNKIPVETTSKEVPVKATLSNEKPVKTTPSTELPVTTNPNKSMLGTPNKTVTDTRANLKKHITDSGYKVCLTRETEDNRNCYRKKIPCFEGELLNPVVEETYEKANLPSPNITLENEKDSRPSAEPIRPEASGKSKGIMTMAQMAERDYENNQNVHSFEEWANIATQSQFEVALKMVTAFGQRSTRGHDYVILLDTSESMRGEKFDLMVKTALEYLEGLQTISLLFNIRDNVGLACFGEETKLLLPPLADYDDIKKEIGKLKPVGPSPLAAGLLMALSGLTHCGTTTIVNHEFKPFIILMTDGIPTRVQALNEEDKDASGALAVSSLLTGMARDQELNAAVGNIAGRGIKICCVPFGSANTDIMNMIVNKTFGKMIPPKQIQRLCRMTQNLFDASTLANKLEAETDINKSKVKTAVRDAGLQDHDKYDDITDAVISLLDPVSQYHGKFKQTKWSALPLGTRVRRGPNWHWKNQDSNMAGTVIGEDVGGMIWVEWDSGHKNVYHYDEDTHIFDIKAVNEPRILIDDLVAVGCKVKRGRNWRFKNQDGGRGNRGTVLRVEPNGKVVVYWERGRLGIYKFAADGVFEVEVCEHNRTLHSPDVIESESDIDEKPIDSDGPLILPSHKSMKPITATWQYLDLTGKFMSFDEETNIKIERAYIRKPKGKLIVEIDKTIHLLLFSKMILENQSDKTTVPVQRLEHLAEKDGNDETRL